MFKLSLCKESCCPTVELVDGHIVIRDDFGGSVNLTLEQLSILVNQYPVIEESVK